MKTVRKPLDPPHDWQLPPAPQSYDGYGILTGDDTYDIINDNDVAAVEDE